MFRACWLVLVVAAIVAGEVAAQTAEEVPAEEIARLIRQLDAEQFNERQNAVTALVKAGDGAIEPLQKAVDDKGSSAELRLRAGEALKQLRTAAIKRSAVKLSEIVEQARLANRGKLEPERLEALLERLVQIIATSTETEQKLPVRFADVADAGGMPESLTRNALIKMDAGRITSLQNSIVLAETAVDITSARDSIIIAGISASISSPRNCIVIAGRNVSLSSGEKNIVLSGSTLSGSIPSDSIVGSAGTIQMSIARNITVINLPENQREAFVAAHMRVADIRGERAPKMVDVPGIVLEVKTPKNSLQGEISITTALTLARESLVLFRRKDGDGEYVARANKEICFPDGKPMPELAGWKLVYCGSGSRQGNYAVFRKGEEQAVMDVTP